MKTDNTERFSNRVDAYTRYRPSYPEALVTFLCERCGLAAGARVADIGSGTGIFTRLLLQRELSVYAVEPNAPMRAAAERSLADFDGFHSIDASAEQTGLSEASIDLITAAQAFHWFNNPTSRTEFARILKPEGRLALIWNKRDVGQEFQKTYDELLRRHAPEYGKAHHMNLDDDELTAFFAPAEMQIQVFDYRQRLDFDGLMGRLHSASYCPPEKSEAYRNLKSEMQALFDAHALDGALDFDYQTRLYLGPIER